MFGLTKFKLIAGLAMIVAIGSYVMWAQGEHARADRLAGEVKAYERCELAVLGKPAPSRDRRTRAAADSPGEVCPPGIASAAAIAANTLACSEALDGSKPYAGVGGTVRLACSAGVQRLYVEWGARDRTATNLKLQLDDAEGRARRALARAQAQARTEAERKARADNERRAAARDGRGLRACDAECMRKRAEGYVAAPR